MADFRSIQTRMWREDAWFQELKTDERLFWIYLFSNPSASICGMYRLPIRTMAFESGLSETRIAELLAAFARAGKAFYEDGTIWIVRMRENQMGKKISATQATGIAADVAKIPPSPLKNRYLAHYGYPIDTLFDAVDTLSIGRATLRYDTLQNDTLRDDTPIRRQVDPDWARAAKTFEDNISMITGSMLPDMLDIWDMLAANGLTGWWEQAVTIAVESNKRSWSYVRGILRRCMNEGHPPFNDARRNGNSDTPQPTGKATIKIVFDGEVVDQEIITHG